MRNTESLSKKKRLYKSGCVMIKRYIMFDVNSSVLWPQVLWYFCDKGFEQQRPTSQKDKASISGAQCTTVILGMISRPWTLPLAQIFDATLAYCGWRTAAPFLALPIHFLDYQVISRIPLLLFSAKRYYLIRWGVRMKNGVAPRVTGVLTAFHSLAVFVFRPSSCLLTYRKKKTRAKCR